MEQLSKLHPAAQVALILGAAAVASIAIYMFFRMIIKSMD